MIVTTTDKTYKGEPAPAGSEVSDLTVSELRKLAKEKGISGASKMKKADLLVALAD